MSPVEETPDLLDDLIRSGAPSHIVKRVAKLLASEEALNERRAKDAARKAEKRSENKASPQTSEDVRGHVGQARMSSSREGVRAEPETTLSEENTSKEESKHSPSARRASAKHLLPDDFVPNEVTFAKAAERGLTRAQVLDKVEALREWSRGKGEKRADWDAVIQGALRRDAVQPRAGPTGKQRGPSFLDIANATDRYLKETAADVRPPYLRLAQ